MDDLANAGKEMFGGSGEHTAENDGLRIEKVDGTTNADLHRPPGGYGDSHGNRAYPTLAAVPGLVAWPFLPHDRANRMFRLIRELRGWTHDILTRPE